METVNEINDIEKLNDNEIIGKPQLDNSEIIFLGKGNILYCEENVVLSDTSIRFSGNNSVIYLSDTESSYFLNLLILNNSIIFIGKNNIFYPIVNISIPDNYKLIMGCDGVIESNVTLGNVHDFEVIDLSSKENLFENRSIYIGDYVAICSSSHISNGVEIGSGAILNSGAHVPQERSLKSNAIYGGNPCVPIKKNVTFVKNSDEVNDEIIKFVFNEGETLSPEKINDVLDKVEGHDIINVLKNIFIDNKTHDRFSI